MNVKKSADYIILPDAKLIIEVLSGSAFLEDYLELKQREAQDLLYDNSYNFIVDLRETEDIGYRGDVESQIKTYIDTVKSRKVVAKRKSAFITNSPKQTAVMMLYKMSSDLPIIIDIFTTIWAANNWLDIQHYDTNEIEAIIEKLKNK
jgi:hypothetical protein